MKITDYIPYGKANAISNSDLSIVSGTDEREARRLVHQARTNGEPICSTCEERTGGYYLPCDVSEAYAYLRQQNARIKSAKAALRGVKKYIKDNGGSICSDFEERRCGK